MTPEERAQQLCSNLAPGQAPIAYAARIAAIAAQIREAEAAARQDERATCARIVASGIRCGAPPESLAAMVAAGMVLEGVLPAVAEDVTWLIEHATDVEGLNTGMAGIIGLRLRSIAARLEVLARALQGPPA